MQISKIAKTEIPRIAQFKLKRNVKIDISLAYMIFKWFQSKIFLNSSQKLPTEKNLGPVRSLSEILAGPKYHENVQKVVFLDPAKISLNDLTGPKIFSVDSF